uniref:Carboxylesterase type B domain-containing protein n=1 Tax=Panagrolaimus sp. PS1159 TaxID=55785 RepID=A0AC35F2V7_9BILA
MFRIIVFLNFIQTLYASFCGEGFMAYGLSLSFGGQFTLGCAQPTCLKFPIIESPTFAFVNGVKDGFVNLPLINERAFINDRAVCETTFDSSNCTAEDQWLAGIAPISNLTNVTSLSLRCCKHWAIKSGKFQKVVTIKNGEMYSGGDIYDSEEEEVLAFDYITNIKKFDTNNGTLVEIVVNRLPCNLVEADKNSEGLSKNKVRIHQAPLVETGDYPAVDYDSIKVENDETSTAAPELATESGIESGPDVTVAQSYSEGGEKYNLDLSPPEVASEAPPAPEYQTLSPNVETQTLPSIVTPEIPQPQNNVEQPQTQIQQNVQPQGLSYAQPGSQNQQQSSYEIRWCGPFSDPNAKDIPITPEKAATYSRQDFIEIVHKILGTKEVYGSNAHAAAEDIIKYYESKISIYQRNLYLHLYAQLFGDIIFNIPILREAQLKAAAGQKVFFYVYNFVPELAKHQFFDGAGHASELSNFFGSVYGMPDFPLEGDVGKVQETIIDLFVNFAKTG